LVVGGWWLVVGGWWLVVGGWWLVVGGWWKFRLEIGVVDSKFFCGQLPEGSDRRSGWRQWWSIAPPIEPVPSGCVKAAR